MEDVQLTLNDIASIKSILEAACSRGTFKAQEMSNIGQIYDKLSKFIEVSQAQLAAHEAQLKQQAEASENQAEGDQNA